MRLTLNCLACREQTKHTAFSSGKRYGLAVLKDNGVGEVLAELLGREGVDRNHPSRIDRTVEGDDVIGNDYTPRASGDQMYLCSCNCIRTCNPDSSNQPTMSTGGNRSKTALTST